MKVPWAHATERDERADERFEAARLHLRIVLTELQRTLTRIEDKRRRGLPGEGGHA